MTKSNYLTAFFMLLFILLSNPLFAGTTGKITGVITEAATGLPMPGANIILVGTNKGTTSDLNGYYTLLNIQPGTYSLKVSFIGLQTQTISDIRVFIDRTVSLNFALKEESIGIGGDVVVVANREKIKTDVSFAQTSITAKDLASVPISPDVREAIAFAPGVYRNDQGQIEIRGGQMDEVGMYMDGISMQNSRSGVGVLNMPQAAIEEVQILRGGFSAEYGQAQSGVINIVTKQSRQNYNGSFSVRYGQAQQKHFGPNIFSKENEYHVGRFLSMDTVRRSMPWTGIDEEQVIFEGWEGWWNDPTTEKVDKYHPFKEFPYGSTAEEAQEIWSWRHRAQEYGHEPDYTIDGTLTGPIPFSGDKLSFFVSGHFDRAMYPFRFYRSDYRELALNGKFTYDATNSLSFKYHILYSNQKGASRDPGQTNLADPRHWLSSAIVAGQVFGSAGGLTTGMYNSDGQTKLNEVTSIKHALKTNYVINNNSFLNTLVTFGQVDELSKFEKPYRDYTNVVKVIGGDSLDIGPFDPVTMVESQFVGGTDILGVHALGGISTKLDFSKNTNLTVKADYTNQFNKIHMFQAGVWGMQTDITLDHGVTQPSHTIDGTYIDELRKGWITKDINFYEFAVYAQDKIEFEGLVLNAGLRVDGTFNDEPDFPMWYSFYSQGFVADSLRAFSNEDAPKGNWKMYLSPRLGVAHPLSETSKLFFNYGYFYQRPTVKQLFNDGYREDYASSSLSRLSSPNLEFRKTIQYELGYEQMVANLFRFTVSGYYRDITNEIKTTTLTDASGWNYDRDFNTGIAEVRGFEIDVRFPQTYFISGWVNYDYRSKTNSGHGYTDFGENKAVGLTQERIKVDVSRAQPVLKANLTVHTPEFEDSPILNTLFSDLTASFQYIWESGKHITWHQNPELNELDPFNLQWEAFSRLDLRVMKGFDLGGSNLLVYMDVRNLLDTKYFHPKLRKNLISSKDYTKFTDDIYFKEIERLGLKPGNVDHPEIQKMLEQGPYWIYYGEPIEVWFGMEFNF